MYSKCLRYINIIVRYSPDHFAIVFIYLKSAIFFIAIGLFQVKFTVFQINNFKVFESASGMAKIKGVSSNDIGFWGYLAMSTTHHFLSQFFCSTVMIFLLHATTVLMLKINQRAEVLNVKNMDLNFFN